MLSPGQKAIIYREVARAGGACKAAVSRIRAESESMRRVTYVQVLKAARSPAGQKAVLQASKELFEIEHKAALEAERLRAQIDARKKLFPGYELYEALLSDAMELLRGSIDAVKTNPANSAGKMDEFVRAVKAISGIVDRKRANVMPAVSSDRHVRCLLRSMREALVSRFGEPVADEINADVRTRLEGLLREAETDA